MHHLAAAATVILLAGFHSPSGNITCVAVPPASGQVPATLLCKIGQAGYAKALQARCSASPISLDWHGFTLLAGRKGSVSCSGGILYDPARERPSYRLLPYGQSWTHSGFTCASRITGVTCTTRGAHGLFISRESWRAW